MSIEAWKFLASLTNILIVGLLVVAFVAIMAAISMMIVGDRYKK